MKKAEILAMNDSELFAAYYDYTVKLVKEANSRGGETKKTTQVYDWIVEQCIKRFKLDRSVLLSKQVIIK